MANEYGLRERLARIRKIYRGCWPARQAQLREEAAQIVAQLRRSK